jgi:hypothetical protein
MVQVLVSDIWWLKDEGNFSMPVYGKKKSV